MWKIRFVVHSGGVFPLVATAEFLRSIGVEILAGGRRLWPDHVKARIVAETLLPDAAVKNVAARYGLRANRISEWRRLAREGRLLLPAPEADADFAPLVLCDADRVLSKVQDPEPSGIVEIACGSVTIRLDGTVPAGRIVEIACGLDGR